MYDGWMSYGGQEIFNGPRTKAYLQHLQPSLSLGADCCECDTLAEALGDAAYSTPAQDDAEWFNPYAPESGGFYGLIPLSVEGFEDSTWEVPLTDLLGDGSVSGRGRRGGRDLRFKMLAVAESDKAMSRGLAWLRNALGVEGCASGDCGGAQVCYLTDCPSCCAEDAPEVATVVDHLDYRALTTAQAASAGAADWSSAIVPKGYKTIPGQVYAWWDERSGVRIERALTGFLPGAVYRVALDFGANKHDTVEIKVTVPGAAELLAPRRVDEAYLIAPQPTQGVVAWEFIATECDHRIVITSDADLTIGMMDVTLTNLDALAYSGQPAYYPSQATSWTAPLLSNPNFHVTQPNPGQWRFAGNPTITLPAQGAEVRSIIPGLVPGRTYRLTLLAALQPTVGEMQGVVSVYDNLGAVLATQTMPTFDLMLAANGGWTTLEFTATDRAVYVSVANLTALSLTASNTLDISVRSLLVEEVAPLVVLPDPHDSLRRYLRDVVLTSGPSVGKVYPSYTAVMKEVEWTMRANVPDPLGEDILVTETLGSARWTVQQTACSMGEEVRINWVYNPSGEYGVQYWPVPAGSTVTNPASATAKSGSHVIRVTQTTANTANRKIILRNDIPITAGVSWIFTLPVRTLRAQRQVLALVTWKNAAGAVMGIANGSLITSDSLTDWQVVVGGGTAPPGTTVAEFAVQISAPAGGFVLNEYAEFDAVMIERAYSQRSYFDGDSPNSVWNGGVAGGAPSTYMRTSATLVVDPDCPPTPPAPRPPDIVNLCLTTPSTWIRYVLDIPALATARSPRSTPTLTITTGASDARGIRARVYANPFARSIEDLDPCAYCGEFLISYMPAHSSLTVDAADKTATIVTSTGEQSALGLLFGSDGGPMTWPVLGCAMPYLVTVDVDADVAPLIAASLSVTPVY